MQYVFGDYTLDPEHYELRQHGALVRLEPRVFNLLAYLVQHPDALVAKETLLAQLWPDQFVADDSLTNAIAQARKALGDTGQTQRYIETIRRRGYRFIAPVTTVPPGVADRQAPPAQETQRLQEELDLDLAGAVSSPHLVPATPLPVLWPEATPSNAQGTAAPNPPAAEWRQLTVLVCRVVGVAERTEPLDPEELLEVRHDYHAISTEVIRQFGGHLTPSQGTELVVHFGYPRAHEDDARRAAQTGLGLVAGMAEFNRRFQRNGDRRLAVRVGIHTGAVLMTTLERGDQPEPLALGETPTIAVQLQSLAVPNTVVISSTTLQLVEGYFVYQALNQHSWHQPQSHPAWR